MLHTLQTLHTLHTLQTLHTFHTLQARSIFEKLQRRYNVEFDASGAIGRRYRRMDEVGTPFCITVDFDTLEDDTVTLRDRDTTEQRRVSVPELLEYLEEQIDG